MKNVRLISSDGTTRLSTRIARLEKHLTEVRSRWNGTDREFRVHAAKAAEELLQNLALHGVDVDA